MALKQLTCQNCGLRELKGAHQLSSLEYMQVVTESKDTQDLQDLQVLTLPPRLRTLMVSAVASPFWEAAACTALTALQLDALKTAAVLPALSLLKCLGSLNSFALTSTPGVAGHLGKLTVGSCLRSLAIVRCELQQLPVSLGTWATRLTCLDLSRNNLSHFPLIVRDMLQLEVLDLSFNMGIHMSLPARHRAFYDPDRRQAAVVADLLNDRRRCTMRVFKIQKHSLIDTWQSDDLACISMVHTSMCSSRLTGGGVASWQFSSSQEPKRAHSNAICWWQR